MAGLGEWLKQNGLEALGAALSENDIDLDILPDLTDEDLERLGLTIGQRRRLLKAAASLSSRAVHADKTTRVDSETEAPLIGREAERRQVTVMFCDLVGSTELSARIDPEDLAKVIRAYQDACAGEVARFSGFLAKLMGDGVLAYFGFPQAHEDSAEQAVRAAIAIIAAASDMATPDGTFAIVETGSLDERLLRHMLEHLPDGTWELVCHPGYNDRDLQNIHTRLRESREQELRILTSQSTRDLLSANGVEVISFRELTAGSTVASAMQ